MNTVVGVSRLISTQIPGSVPITNPKPVFVAGTDRSRSFLGVDYLTVLFNTPRHKVEKARKQVFANMAKERAAARKGGADKTKTNMVNEKLLKRKAAGEKPAITFYEARFAALEAYGEEECNSVEILQNIRKYYQDNPQ